MQSSESEVIQIGKFISSLWRFTKLFYNVIDTDTDDDDHQSHDETDSDEGDEWNMIYSQCPICRVVFPNLRAHVPFCNGPETEKRIVKIKPETEEDALKKFEKIDLPGLMIHKMTEISFSVVATNKKETEKNKLAKQNEIHNTCGFCLEKIPLKKKTGHRRFHCREKRYQCQNCKIRYRNRTTLEHHKTDAVCVPLPFECKICLRRFKEQAELRYHAVKNSCDGKELFAEEPCASKGLKRKREVKDTSLVSYRRDAAISCTLCGTASANVKDFENHRQNFCKGTPPTLGECNEVSLPPTPGEVVEKNPQVNIICHSCNWQCENIDEFQIHTTQYCRVQLPYACEYCPLRFYSLAMLKYHGYECQD